MSPTVSAMGEVVRPGLARILTAALVGLNVNLLVQVYPQIGRWWICCPLILSLGVGMAIAAQALPRTWRYIVAAGTFGNLLLLTIFIFDEHWMLAPASPALLVIVSGAAAAICMRGIRRPRPIADERPISILAALSLMGLMAVVGSGRLRATELIGRGVDFLITLLLVGAVVVALLQRLR
jgi:hypothetical protein